MKNLPFRESLSKVTNPFRRLRPASEDSKFRVLRYRSFFSESISSLLRDSLSFFSPREKPSRRDAVPRKLNTSNEPHRARVIEKTSHVDWKSIFEFYMLPETAGQSESTAMEKMR